MAKDRGAWNSRTGFLLAAIGSAVGLGNIWRFPYIAFKNGGGAFLIPYLIALFCVGITLMIVEQGMGQRFRASMPLACARANKKWEFLGWWPVLFVTFGIALYYSVVISWCVNYFVFSLNLSWGADTQAFFQQTFLGITSGPFDFSLPRLTIFGGMLSVWVLAWYIISKHVNCGIERVNKILMPLLLLLVVVLVVWSARLPGASVGVASYLTPDMTRIWDPNVWSDAFSQIFFSLSLGFGIMVAYASYLPKRSPVVNNVFITTLSNSGFEVFAGFAVFATLGYMSFASGIPIKEVVSGGPGLAFVTYPKAINMLPFGSNIFGAVFFLALIFAGITSIISILEAFVSSVIDKFGWERKKITTVLCIVGAAGSSIFTLGNGLYVLDIVDNFLNNYGLLSVGLLEAILIGWLFGAKNFAKVLNVNPGRKVGKVWMFLLRYFAPAILLVIIIGETYSNIKHPYEGYSWTAIITIGVGWLVATLVAAIIFAKRKWKASHHVLGADIE